MKRMLLGAGVVLALLLAAGCSDPVGGGSNSSGGGTVTNNDPTYIGFEDGTPSYPFNSTLSKAGDVGFFTPAIYNTMPSGTPGSGGSADTSATLPNSSVTVTAASDQVKSGSTSAKVVHVLHPSRYSADQYISDLYMIVGAAGTEASGLNGPIPGTTDLPATSAYDGSSLSKWAGTKAIDNHGKTIRYRLNVYVEANSKIDSMIFTLYDAGQNPAQSHAQTLVKGQWNLLEFYWKGAASPGAPVVEDRSGTPTSLAATVVKALVNGVETTVGTDYVGGSFDPSTVRFFGFRMINSDKTAVTGDPITYWVDDLGWKQSALTTAAPTIDVAAGTYDVSKTVTLTSTTAGATIKYTVDGTDPKTSVTALTYTSPVSVASSLTLQAYAKANGYDDSPVVSAAYVISAIPPVYSPSDISYDAAQNVAITTTTAGAKVYYTLTSDGTDPADPTAASTEYTGTVALALPANGSKTYKFKAVSIKSGVPSSAVIAKTYILTPPNVALAPTIKVADFEADTAGTTTYPIISGTAGSVVANVVTLANVWTTASTPGATTGNTSANVLAVPTVDYNQYPVLPLTIPTGHSLSEYGYIKVSAVFPANGGDNAYKSINAFIGAGLADGTPLYANGASFVGSSASTGGSGTVWTEFSIAIDPAKAAAITGNSLKIALGISKKGAGDATGPFYLDSISLVPKAVALTTFEADTAGTTTYPILSGTAGSVVANVVTLANVWTTASTPGTTTGNTSANVLAVPSVDYNQFARITVTLPQGSTLSSFGYISVKAVFPANGGDNGYKNISAFVAASLPDGTSLYNSPTLVGQSIGTGEKSNTWTTFLIPIDQTYAANVTAGVVDVALGISRSGGATGPYYLDDIGFVPK